MKEVLDELKELDGYFSENKLFEIWFQWSPGGINWTKFIVRYNYNSNEDDGEYEKEK